MIEYHRNESNQRRELPPGINEQAIEAREQVFRNGAEPILGELEHPQKFTRFIEIMNEDLTRNQQELGLTTPSDPEWAKRISFESERTDFRTIDPTRIHLLPDQLYDQVVKSRSLGRYQFDFRRILIRQSDVASLLQSNEIQPKILIRLFRATQHEAIHSISYEQHTPDRMGDPRLTRQGYQFINQDTRNSRFVGLNEMVVEQNNIDVLQESLPVLTTEFSEITEEHIRAENYLSYTPERQILFSIVESISNHHKSDPRAVMAYFKRGLYNGERGHLNWVNDVYGPGSVRLLSVIRSPCLGSQAAQSNTDTDQVFTDYFAYRNKPLSFDERCAVARQVLDEDDYQAFLQENG